MNTAEILDFCLGEDDTCLDDNLGLKLIVNKGTVVVHDQLPTGCRYCELKAEFYIGESLW